MVTRFSLGLLAALALFVSLLVSMPARLLSLLLPEGQVYMQGFSGSLWRGSASRALVRTDVGLLHLGELNWQLSPLSLLSLSPALQLQSRWGAQHVAGRMVLRGEDSFDLEDIEASVSADLLRQFAPVAMTGTLQASFERLQIRHRLPVSATGRLVWQNGGWEAPRGYLPLGSYAIDFKPSAGDSINGDVLTLAGAVAASGSVALSGREYDVNVLVRSDSGLDPQVQQALSLIATPEGDGFRVLMNGELLQ